MSGALIIFVISLIIIVSYHIYNKVETEIKRKKWIRKAIKQGKQSIRKRKK